MRENEIGNGRSFAHACSIICTSFCLWLGKLGRLGNFPRRADAPDPVARINSNVILDRT